MGFRFRKTIKLLPGVRLNVSKGGVSTSVGGKGVSFNLGKGGRATTTVGVPGSGMSYSESVSPGKSGKWVYIAVVVVASVAAYAAFRLL